MFVSTFSSDKQEKTRTITRYHLLIVCNKWMKEKIMNLSDFNRTIELENHEEIPSMKLKAQEYFRTLLDSGITTITPQSNMATTLLESSSEGIISIISEVS